MLQSLIAFLGLVFGMVVLIVFSSVPLWLFSIFGSLTSALLMPIFGANTAYVYGEHLARTEPELVDAPAPAPVS
ncbi:MAG: hypothetical protein KJN63_10145 [Acidimicrobiia bacterium]|nr:hypothetical protein [Acidimicrobiia bacterium]